MPARNRRLPRHLSWPLTASDVRAALGEQAAGTVALHFDERPHEDGTLLRVEWIPHIASNYGSGLHPSCWNSVRVRVAPLPAAQRATARRVLKAHALDELVAWVEAARSAPEGWALSRRSRSWRPAENATVHRDDEQPYR